MIKLNNASFTYAGEWEEENQRPPSVSGITFSVRPGECVVLCGRSGSGKSTVLRMINGLAPQFYPGVLTGEITIGGTNPALLSSEERATAIGSVFQDPRSQFFMSVVRDELAFLGENLGMRPLEIRELIETAASQIGISELLDRPLDKLSSGQKQKVAIAAASVLNPKVLILDEPSANLDEASTQELTNLLNQFKKRGMAIVVSEHRLHAFAATADRYVLIEQGRQTDVWTKEEFLKLDVKRARAYGLRHPDLFLDSSNDENQSDSEDNKKSPGWKGRNVTYIYKRTGVGIRSIDFTPSPGKVTAVIGENGAGKTTLCKVFCGLKRQKSGAIVYNEGKDLSPARRRTLSYLVMQDADYQLYTDSVAAEVMLGRIPSEEIKKRARDALDSFGLTQYSDRHPASLSGGQKQRVTLAAAYCADVPLVILDEPTSGLDGDGVLTVANWTRQLAAQGKTVLIITHDSLLVDLACDESVELSKHGGIIQKKIRRLSKRSIREEERSCQSFESENG